MASPKKRHSGYTIVSVRRGTRMVSVAQFRCIACGGTTEVTLGGRATSAQVIANIAKLRGWQADPNRANRIYCPVCLGEPVREDNTTQEVLMSNPPKSAEPREPTPDERQRIRELLDKYFDDELGTYANGYSDDVIAAEVGVPRAIVTRIRDAGWGLIRQTPEIVEVRRELATLRKEYAGNLDLALVMTKEISEGLDKLTKLEARVVALATAPNRR
jgi:hypothetical protein